MVLKGLSLSPRLAVMLRRFHLEAQLAYHQSHGDWHDRLTPKSEVMTVLPEGINAWQRTPLEAHFHTYGGRE